MTESRAQQQESRAQQRELARNQSNTDIMLALFAQKFNLNIDIIPPPSNNDNMPNNNDDTNRQHPQPQQQQHHHQHPHLTSITPIHNQHSGNVHLQQPQQPQLQSPVATTTNNESPQGRGTVGQ